MASQATATLDANDAVCGPVILRGHDIGALRVEITDTISVSLQRRFAGNTYKTVKLPDGTTPATWTSGDTDLNFEGPGEYQLIASGASGGSAACYLWVA